MEHCLKQQLPELEGVQESTVWSILNERDIKPHRMSYYLVRKDPELRNMPNPIAVKELRRT